MNFLLLDRLDMGISKNRGTPKSSIWKGFSIINHPFWGTPIFGNIHFVFLNSSQLASKNCWQFGVQPKNPEGLPLEPVAQLAMVRAPKWLRKRGWVNKVQEELADISTYDTYIYI